MLVFKSLISKLYFVTSNSMPHQKSLDYNVGLSVTFIVSDTVLTGNDILIYKLTSTTCTCYVCCKTVYL